MNDREVLPQYSGRRKFYEIPKEYENVQKNVPVETEHKDVLLSTIYHSIASHNARFEGPFGQRKVVYCDYTASGQPLYFIENYLMAEVMPFYGNTHTTSSVSSLQSTLFRHEAKDIVRNAVNASEHDAVLFCGSGCTSAVHKLIHALDLEDKDVVVFVGPYEHHSNLLPWREVKAKVVRINENSHGLLDLQCLEDKLIKYSGKNHMLIGSFSAASNVTGILTDDKSVTIMLHKYGALACWDYAAAGPYVNINMNPVVSGPDQGLVYKDAIFLSPHKFVGGPDSPGILIAKKKLFRNLVPLESGGGTVFFVTRESHRYLQEIEMREEGGTPSIIGAIRAGMAFQLKQSVGTQFILKRDKEICMKALTSWSLIPNLKILGSTQVERLPIFSFVVQHPSSGLYLHYNFVCAVLNDLFGIQSRGGCACSGPYALDLLGIDEKLAELFDQLLVEDSALDRIHLRRYREYSDREVLRPGFSRLNIPYFMDEADIEFIIIAVSMVAENGWKLLPQYMFNPETGEWRHRAHQVFSDRKWLGSVSYSSGHFSFFKPSNGSCTLPKTGVECINEAREILQKALQVSQRMQLPDQDIIFDNKASKLRWFLLPSEAQQYLHIGSTTVPIKKPPFKIRENCCIDDSLSTTSCMKNQNLCYSFLGEKKNNNIVFQQNLSSACVSQKNDNRKKKSISVESEHNSCKVLCSSEEINHPLGLAMSNFTHWHSPPQKLFRAFKKAIKAFKMIQNKDRILVCLSGGKDSLSLLHTLHQYQFYARKESIHFDLGAITVDPKSPSYNPSPLVEYLASLSIPYFYEEQAILEQAAELEKCKSICSFCSRLKRGRIYACARREGYNVIALGQHLDDLAESFIMSVFHNGRLRTMKASYIDQSGMLRVIRPFAFVREKELRKFAEEKKLPVITENCPACFEAPKERHRVKQLLANQEIQFPRLYLSLKSAMLPLMAINRTGIESKLTEDIFRISDDDIDIEEL